jgi:hypothetical protein
MYQVRQYCLQYGTTVNCCSNWFYMQGTWHLPQDKILIKSYRKDELCICFVHDNSKINRAVTFVFATSPLRCITCNNTIHELTVSILVPF